MNGEQRKLGATHNGRLDFLDALRGIAALAIAIEHCGERISSGFAYFVSHFFQVGQFGVMLFFLTSGFIIPNSIERMPTIKLFWVRRVLRLYPLYIFSMSLAILLNYLGKYHMMPGSFNKEPITTVAINITMLQEFLGKGSIIPLYWTLNFEMLFYIMVSILLLFGILERTMRLATIWFGLALVAGFVLPKLLHNNSGNGLFFNFATMFCGTVIYRWYQRRMSWKQTCVVLFLAIAAILDINWFYFSGHDDPSYLGTRSFLPMVTAWLVAYGVFLLGFTLRTRLVPNILRYLGRISYSIYLMQALVISVGPLLNTRWLTAIVWIVSTLLVSSLTYYYIEKPFIELGRKAYWDRSKNVVKGVTF